MEGKDRCCTISVIVPVYNAEKYLCRCVDSILAQTFTNFELILVDDGSPDRCGAMCDSYQKSDERVKVIHQENGGVSSARNAGMDAAAGEYLMFCDSDDAVAKNWCDELFRYQVLFPDAFITSGLVYIKQSGETMDISPLANAPYDEYAGQEYFNFLCENLGGFSTKIYQKNVLDTHSIRFDPDLILGEDCKFYLEYAKHWNRVVVLHQRLYYYYSNPKGCCNSLENKNYLEKSYPYHVYKLEYFQQRHCDITALCSNLLALFLRWLEYTFIDSRYPGIWDKLKRNHEIVQMKEFKTCLDHIEPNKEGAFFVQLLKTKNYYIIFLVQKLIAVKNHMFRRK